ncbi:MAG: hypothetical protein SGILL_000603 [Bacillariaceae sp.]
MGQVPACRKASSLVMLRLARAFEQRQPPSTKADNGKTTVAVATKPSGGAANVTPTTVATTIAPGAPKSTTTSPTANKTTPDTATASSTTTAAAAAAGTTSTAPTSPPKATQPGASNSTTTATNGTAAPKSSPSNNTTNKKAPVVKKLPTLKALMLRKVKVTKLVQQEVQFMGSDLLKVLQVLPNPPTIAECVDTCLVIMENESKIKQLFTIIQTELGRKAETIDPSNAVFFGVFALQSLQALRTQSISTFELAHDFDYIYQMCYKNPEFETCVNALNPSLPPSAPGSTPPTPKFAPDTEARNICWKLARLLALKQDHVSAKVDPDGKHRRKNHIISSTASILFAASLGQAKIATKAGNTGNQEPPTKRLKTDSTDFAALTSALVAQLEKFITKHSHNSSESATISNAEIRLQLYKLYGSIDKLKIVRDYDKGARKMKAFDSGHASIANVFPPEKVRFILQNYRTIVHDLASEAQTNLQIAAALKKASLPIPEPPAPGAATVRMAIANVLMLFPMVLGEPWGIHRDAPKITTRLLCKWDNTKPSLHLKGSVAVVLIASDAHSSSASTRASYTPDAVMVDAGPPPTPPRPRPPSLVKNGELEPPVINDSMELNEWTLSILSLSVVKPSDSLLMYLGKTDRSRGDGTSCLHDVIVPVLNRGLLRVQGALRTSDPNGPKDTRLTVGRKDGQVYVSGQVDEGIQLCASVVGFYYHSLEAIIYDQMERMEFLGQFGSLLQSESFHRALLTCCYACTLKGAGTTHKIEMNGSHKETTVHLLMETIESSPYTFLKVTEALRRALVVTGDPSKKKLGSPIVPGLPVILQKHLQKLEVQMVDSIVWATSSSSKSEGSLALTIKTMKSLPGAWPPDVLESTLPEEILDSDDSPSTLIEEKYKPAFSSSTEANFLSYVLRKLLKIVFFRIQKICVALKLSNETHVHAQILVAFRYLLRNHLELFYDRHIDQLILCTVYGVCRVMRVNPEVTFARLMDAYIAVRKDDQGERACRVILRHVKLVANENEFRPEGKVVGNLIVFYNQVYVPKMQKHFTTSASLKNATEDYRKSHPLQSCNGFSTPATAANASKAPVGSVSKTSTIPASPSSKTQQQSEPKANGGASQSNTTEKQGSSENTPTSASLKLTPQVTAASPAASSDKNKADGDSEPNASNGTTEAKDTVIVVQIQNGKEVKVVESQGVNGAVPSANGSQKRTFSTMGGTTS